jgi:hypothetical protein
MVRHMIGLGNWNVESRERVDRSISWTHMMLVNSPEEDSHVVDSPCMNYPTRKTALEI